METRRSRTRLPRARGAARAAVVHAAGWLLGGALLAGACARPHTSNTSATGQDTGLASEEPVLGRFTVVSTAELAAPVSEAPVQTKSPRRVESLDPQPQSSAQVDRAMAGLVPELRTCYEREARGERSLGGKMRVSITFEPSGAVRHVRTIENTTGSAGIARCVEGRIRRLRVDPDPQGRAISSVYPLVFHASSSGR